jgi:hypothetical protein
MVSAGEDPVTPQNWFKEAQGQPAQALPKEDVGPHLPPGGIVSHRVLYDILCITKWHELIKGKVASCMSSCMQSMSAV